MAPAAAIRYRRRNLLGIHEPLERRAFSERGVDILLFGGFYSVGILLVGDVSFVGILLVGEVSFVGIQAFGILPIPGIELAEHEGLILLRIQVRKRQQKGYHGPHLVIALERRPRGHPGELDAVLHDVEELPGRALDHDLRKARWNRRHLPCDSRRLPPRPAVARQAARLVMARSLQDERRIVERRRLDAQRVCRKRPGFREFQKPGRNSPVTGTRGDRDDAGGGNEKPEEDEHGHEHRQTFQEALDFVTSRWRELGCRWVRMHGTPSPEHTACGQESSSGEKYALQDLLHSLPSGSGLSEPRGRLRPAAASRSRGSPVTADERSNPAVNHNPPARYAIPPTSSMIAPPRC